MNDMSRADLHVHSSASQLSKLGVQRSLHIPECATDPLEVYALAKRRGMDFVTVTDHDTIEGALAIAHLPDTFISEELTASFKSEPQAVHVLCYGITPDDHEWLQSNRDGVRAVSARPRDRRRARPSVLRGDRAAHRPPPPPPGRAVSDLGDPQRLARQGAQSAGVRVHRDPRGDRDRGVR
jgi:hypothetical protein